MKRVLGALALASDHVRRNDRPVHWCAQLFMLLAASPFFIGAGLSLASGLGRLADVVIFVSLLWLSVRAGGFVSGFLLSCLPLRLPWRLTGHGIALMVAITLILQRTQVQVSGALAIASAALAAGYLAGSGIWLVFSSRRRKALVFAYAGLGMAAFVLFFGWLFADDLQWPDRGGTEQPEEAAGSSVEVWPADAGDPSVVAGSMPVAGQLPEDAAESDTGIGDPDLWQPVAETLLADNPADFGPYGILTFTYGSGLDPYRPEFAEEADVRTGTADASAFLTEWDWSRKWLYGAEPSSLPLNGRVWLPVVGGTEGEPVGGSMTEGPYPVVLIMHGNHSMADYSDEGYGYLGELLASRGYVAVSVDANFLNHSTWEGDLGDMSDNIALRAWIALKHLEELEQLSLAAGNPLSGKADMSRVALIGHSRGGQAAMLASCFDDFFAGDEHRGKRIGRDFGIKAVIALAPTDAAVDRRTVSAGKVHYLLLQGSHDADVSAFPGDRQYHRMELDPDGDEFLMKASLYIMGANHGQFNEDWGRRDINYPAQWLLDDRQLLSGDDQRQIAKVYVSAFLDTVFGKSEDYLPMFRDYRLASKWLPDTGYISRYSDSRFLALTDFDEDYRKETGRFRTVIYAEGAELWTEEELKDRHGGTRINRAGKISWSGEEAGYVIELPEPIPWPEEGIAEAVGFELADLSPGDEELEVTIELELRDGIVLRAALDDLPPVPEPAETRFLKPFPGDVLEQSVKDGGLSTSEDTVLQTYYVPLTDERFELPAPDAAPEEIKISDIGQIRIVLERNSGGTVLLDEIGLFLESRS